MTDTLLPPNSTPLERALEETQARIGEIPVPIPTVWRWDECPEELLPWLAWALSVDFWSDEWPTEKKREIIRNSIELHRLKGTLEGIRRYLDFAGISLVRAITPPADPYWAPEDVEALKTW